MEVAGSINAAIKNNKSESIYENRSFNWSNKTLHRVIRLHELDGDFLSDKLKKKYAELTKLMIQGVALDEDEDGEVPVLNNDGTFFDSKGGTINPKQKKERRATIHLDDPLTEYDQNDDVRIHRPPPIKKEHLDQSQIEFRLFENRLSFYIGARTAVALSLLLKDIKSEEEKSTDKSQFTVLKDRLTRKWFAAIAEAVIGKKTQSQPTNITIFSDGDLPPQPLISKINFDPNSINTTIFDVIQMSIRSPAKLYEKHGSHMIVTALGDSRASPHFFSRSGLTSGRIGVEVASQMLFRYHSKIVNEEGLLTGLASTAVKKDALMRGKLFVQTLHPFERSKLFRKKVLAIIEKAVEDTKSVELIYPYEYRVVKKSLLKAICKLKTCTDEMRDKKKNIFELQLAGKKKFLFTVNREGLLELIKDEKKLNESLTEVIELVKDKMGLTKSIAPSNEDESMEAQKKSDDTFDTLEEMAFKFTD